MLAVGSIVIATSYQVMAAKRAQQDADANASYVETTPDHDGDDSNNGAANNTQPNQGSTPDSASPTEQDTTAQSVSASWKWNDDGTSIMTITDSSGNVIGEVNATVTTSEEPAKCTSDGVLTYTASASWEGQTYTDPDREVSDSMCVDLFGYDDGYTDYCSTAYGDTDVVDEAGEPYVIGGALGAISITITDDESYAVENGELVKIINRRQVYSLEEITVIYTRAEIAGAPIMRGDADGNGSVNVKDVTAIQRHLAELEPLTGDRLTAADVNADGVIAIDDATAVQNYLAEYADPYQIGELIFDNSGLPGEESETELIL